MLGFSAVNLWWRACRTGVGVEFCPSWNCVYTWFKCACVYKGVQQKFKLLHTRTWNRIGRSMTARPPMLWPSNILPALRLIPARENLARVSKMLFQFIFYINILLWNFATLNCVNRGMYVVNHRECPGGGGRGGGSLGRRYIFASQRVELGPPSFVASNYSDSGIN